MSEVLKTASVRPSCSTPEELAAMVVAAYVSNNNVQPKDLPELLVTVREAIAGVERPETPASPVVASKAEIKKSITNDGLISFIDGSSYKTLKRHLTKHNLTPESYRRKFGLPDDYPMVSANYSARRSELAKAVGLGAARRKAA